MATLAQVRQQHPEYNDMGDGALAMALHRKFYSDVPMADYLGQLGIDRGDVLYELRDPGNGDGDYLRQQLAAPGAGESQQQAEQRQAGQLTPERRAGGVEGAARAALQGATFGFGDELVAAGAAAFNPDQSQSFGDKFNAYLSREQGLVDNFREDNPVVAYGSEIAGAIPTGVAAGGQLAGRGATLGMRALTGAGVGAGQGAAYGFGSADGDLADRGMNALMSAGVGGVVGGAIPLVSNTIGSAVQRGQQGRILDAAAKAAPTADDLKSAASAMFEQATGGTPLAITDNSYMRFLGDVQSIGQKLRINANLDPKSVGLSEMMLSIADDLARGGTAVDMKDLHLLRQAAQRVAMSSEGRDAAFANTVIRRLDDFVQTLKPADILGGADPSQATNALYRGISTWSRANKVGLVEEAIRVGQAAASGPEKGIRNALRTMLFRKPDVWNRFTTAEQQAIKDVIDGTPGSNLMKLIGTFGFGGNTATNGIGGAAGMALGQMAGGPVGMVLGPAIGSIGRNASEKMTTNLANRAMGAVATEGLQSLPKFDPNKATALERMLFRTALPGSKPLVPSR
ncbi:hypothetical protein [Paradevosia shaoguanensis]|uniref:hypothetical protein n=1 Tax=Paradevosia shaoguanensis TaxID=1335043 RepID=UPI001932D2E7|nr:hypothetical protein [Paradevosia shaoguanensis]